MTWQLSELLGHGDVALEMIDHDGAAIRPAIEIDVGRETVLLRLDGDRPQSIGFPASSRSALKRAFARAASAFAGQPTLTWLG